MVVAGGQLAVAPLEAAAAGVVDAGRAPAVAAPLAQRGERTLPGADPSWFGYPLTLREGGADRRRELQRFLLERGIDSRLLLAGNMVRQPGFLGLEHRVVGDLEHADRITEAALWVGCWPGLDEPRLDWIAESLTDFLG